MQMEWCNQFDSSNHSSKEGEVKRREDSSICHTVIMFGITPLFIFQHIDQFRLLKKVFGVFFFFKLFKRSLRQVGCYFVKLQMRLG